ncbi:MAG: FHA domain-containing protein [Methylobacter sp.]|nr:FHA domain-containing protein [Methylobacter sp.]
MPKLTVFFKDKAIHSAVFENGIVHIGRDESNDLSIDSLAVAPIHAAINIQDHVCTIKQLNESFPLIINGNLLKTGSLNNSDTIVLGKHTIIFNTTESIALPPANDYLTDLDVKSFNQEIEADLSFPTANLQIMNGNNIGKILQLKKPMTRLGHNGNGVILISKRKDGYFVCILESGGTISLNNEPLNDKSLKLNTNDILVIDNMSLQFFLN